MRVGIIGGGAAGLTTAYALSRAGVGVDLYEKEPHLGGLAASCLLGELTLDRFYHFVCGGDSHLVELCEELGLTIHWKPTRTSFYHDGKLYPFGSARDLVRFDALSWGDRFRLAKLMVSAYRRRDCDDLDRVPAEQWLVKELGERAYRVIWHPLLSVKFGERYRDISAAWVWHRLHRLLSSRRHVLARELLGYMDGGAGELVSRLAARISEAGARVYTNTEVSRIAARPGGRVGVQAGRGEQEYEAVVCAIPAPRVCALFEEDLPELRSVEYIGVVCLLMVLERPVTDSFWINVNDPRVAFNGFIEFSNLNPGVSKGKPVVYVPFYCHPSEPRFSLPDEALLEEYLRALGLIQPALDRASVLHWRVSRDPYAQPICPCGFGARVPPRRGPRPGVFVLDSSQLYPADRNLSGTIGMARQMAQLVLAEIGKRR
jgi:protoporphyrinogen oxidase